MKEQRLNIGGEQRNVDYVLRFSPGMNYMPGSVPFGIGDPLQGLSGVIKDFEKRFSDTRVELFATYMLSIIPLLVLFIYATRPFIQGITSGAFKA